MEKKEFTGSLSIDLYECEEIAPPSRQEPSVRKVGMICCNLAVEYSDLRNFKSKTGIAMKKLEYELELVPSGASIDFVVYVDGVKQPGKSAKVCVVE